MRQDGVAFRKPRSKIYSDDEDAKEEFYSLVTHVEGDFRGLGVRVVEA